MPALCKNTNKQQLLQQMVQAQLTAQEDNEKLKVKMQSTLDAFKKYCRKVHSIPHDERHSNYLERSLSELAGVNPFYEFPYRVAADDQTFAAEHDTTGGDRSKTPVHLRLIPDLSAAQIANWRKSKPSNWLEMPGTITILHDSNNICVVWAAGVDGAPITIDAEQHRLENFLISDDHIMH